MRLPDPENDPDLPFEDFADQPAGREPGEDEASFPNGPRPLKTYDFGIFTPTEEMLAAVEPRPWLYGTFLQRGYVSVLSGISGGGKSSLVMTMAVEMATHRQLLGHHLWRPLRVWYCNLDDPKDELVRRLKAVLLHYQGKVSPKDLAAGLILSARNPEFIIARRLATGEVVAEPLKEALLKVLREFEIDVLIVDPFVRTHRAEENSNPEMAYVMNLWIELAEQAQVAILLLHHVRKGSVDAEDQAASRGAGAIIDLARSANQLAKMTAEEAKSLNLSSDARRYYFCIGSPKASMAPPPTEREWYRLVSVPLGNATPEYPRGDHVQAVERWRPEPLFDGLSPSVIKTIFDKFREGPEPGERYAPTRRGKSSERWAGKVIMEITGKNVDQARAILKEWSENDVISSAEYYSKHSRSDAQGVELNEGKAAEMTPWEPLC